MRKGGDYSQKLQGIRLGAFLLFLLLCAQLACAAVAEAAPMQARLVRVGYDAAYGNIELSPAGRPTGYGYEYLMQVAQFTDWQYQFVSCDWNQCLRMLENGEVDLLPSMQRTAARERTMDFSQDKQGYEYATLLARADNDNLHYDDPQGLQGRRAGLVRGNAINDDFETYLSENQVRMERMYFESVEDMVDALLAGSVDIITGSSTLKGKELKVVAHLGVRAFYVGVRRSARGLLESLNEAQRRMSAQDIYFTARLHEKYFLLSNSRVGLSRNEAEFIRQSPPLRVAVNPAWWPLESYDTLSALPKGILSDVLNDMARRLGLQFEYVHTKSYEESQQLMMNGEVDIITGLSGSLEKALPGVVGVSLPVLRLPLVLVGQSGEDMSTPPLRVAVPRLFSGNETLRSSLPPESLVYMESAEECATAVRKGDTPLALMSAWRFDRLSREPGYASLRVLRLLPVDADVVLGVAHNISPQLLAVLNKGVMSLDRQFINTAILRHTTSGANSPQWRLLWRTYQHWLAPGILLFCLIILGLILYQRERTTRALRQVALTDEVTGMGNFKAFCQRSSKLIKHADYALVSMDINDFKSFNAYYGHQAGNTALRRVARELWYFLEDKELACRIGGDVFLLLLHWPAEGGLLSVRQRLDQWRSALGALESPGSQQRLKITFSFGLYHLKKSSSKHMSVEAALDCASIARKFAKESYKTTFGMYDEAMHQRITDERLFEQEMLGAQARGEFVVSFQPKYDLYTLGVVGAEALVRWAHPTRGEIMPSAFLDLFERNGFIAKLDMFVLDFVCRLLRRWKDEGRALLPISVNMSRLHVLDYNFVQAVRDVITMHGVDPQYIELEMTETAFLENTAIFPEIMMELREFGLRLSMDDFGTGYSSLNMLKSMPVHVLKLDKAFLASEDQGRSRDIVRHVVAMARDLNLKVVCEGIEKEEDVLFLRSAHCHMGQGYYFARPMSAAQFERLVFGDVPDVAAVVDVPLHHNLMPEETHKKSST